MKTLGGGGAGPVGQWVSRGLAVASEVKQLLIADLDDQLSAELAGAIARKGVALVAMLVTPPPSPGLRSGPTW